MNALTTAVIDSSLCNIVRLPEKEKRKMKIKWKMQ